MSAEFVVLPTGEGFWPSKVMFDGNEITRGHAKQCQQIADNLNRLFVVADTSSDAMFGLMALHAELQSRSDNTDGHTSTRDRARRGAYRRCALSLASLIESFQSEGVTL